MERCRTDVGELMAWHTQIIFHFQFTESITRDTKQDPHIFIGIAHDERARNLSFFCSKTVSRKERGRQLMHVVRT